MFRRSLQQVSWNGRSVANMWTWVSLNVLTICSSKQVLKPFALGLDSRKEPAREKNSADHYYGVKGSDLGSVWKGGLCPEVSVPPGERGIGVITSPCTRSIQSYKSFFSLYERVLSFPK